MASLFLLAVVCLLISYRFYGNFLLRTFQLTNKEQTPAHQTENQNKIDFSPTSKFVLFSHHFASIAGAGPIVGPIIALSFGWLPVYLWLLFGAIFIGGVHDFSSIAVSVKNRGSSLAEILKKQSSKKTKVIFLLFTWLTLLIVIAVFTNLVLKTFQTKPSTFTSSVISLLLALVLALTRKYTKISFKLVSFFCVLLLLFSVKFGLDFPVQISTTWLIVLIFFYILFSSISPVWLLLQPRDFLNSFLLYALIILGVLGLLTSRPEINLPSYTSFQTKDLGFLFPILFITVACGAVSGFHSWVGSGTSSKQLNQQTDSKSIGYGAMLLESLLAIFALFAASSLTLEEFSALYKQKNFILIFAQGTGNLISKIPFFSNLSLIKAISVNFAALAVSAFILTTLDTSSRLARITLQEVFSELKIKSFFSSDLLTTLITLSLAGLLFFSKSSLSIWPIFGCANQLLAVFALLTIFLHLASHRPNKNNQFVLFPLVFISFATFCALFLKLFESLLKQDYLIIFISLLLLVISSFIILDCFVQFRKNKNDLPKRRN